MGSDAKKPDHPGSQRRNSTEDQPFDLWLRKQLHAMYDEVAKEPVPDDLLNLIDRDAEASTDEPKAPSSEHDRDRKR